MLQINLSSLVDEAPVEGMNVSVFLSAVTIVGGLYSNHMGNHMVDGVCVPNDAKWVYTYELEDLLYNETEDFDTMFPFLTAQELITACSELDDFALIGVEAENDRSVIEAETRSGVIVKAEYVNDVLVDYSVGA